METAVSLAFISQNWFPHSRIVRKLTLYNVWCPLNGTLGIQGLTLGKALNSSG